MKNNLFNDSEIRKYAKNKAFQLTIQKHDFLKTHAEKVEQGDFKSERSSYLYFYDFLRKVLGYKREENILFEDKEDIGRGKVEFVLKSDDKKFMVIELKDQTTDLDKPQARMNDKRTPIDQAFSYAQHSDPDNPIDWIMVSNFKEFRLYNYNKRSAKCISFTYEDLLNKDIFKQFMVSFSHKSHIEKDYPTKILESTLITEQKLEKNFYQLFHETRLMLTKELEEINDLSRSDAVHYAQLILNRYMFIAFAEDTGLLKSQISTDTIITPIIKGNLRHRSIWQRLNELFLDINEGNEYKKIPAYNGGLFEEDLDFIKIRDIVEDQEIFQDTWQKWDFDKQEENIKNQLGPQVDIVNPIYKNLLIISSFDFSSELDVNILGHIFENSIGDLEEIKEDSKGRRKKEGIFYTPDYITDYICRNTIIPYLSKNGKSNTVEELIAEYHGSQIKELDEKLKNIRIVDPACGSGAFLNKAADILVEIHQAIHEILYKDLKETLKPYFDHINQRREILLSNIYGVDLNEESVEITKLSLFLKVCRKGLKLPNLDKNIKCGNSLIDDPEYTDKPFSWEKEFPEIFAKAGFDVVIGNPPYVRMEKFKEIKPYLKANYISFAPRSDMYVYFFEKGINVLKKNGKLGFISSNKFIKANYGERLRNFILDNTNFERYVDHTFDGIFEDATTYPSIFIFNKGDLSKKNRIFVDNSFHIQQSRLNKGSWSFEKPEVLELRDKINQIGVKLKEISNLNIYYGIKTGLNEAFIINENIKNQLLSNSVNPNYIKPLLRGKDIKKWNINFEQLYVVFIKYGDGKKLEESNDPIYVYLKEYEKKLKKRGQVKNGQHHWLELDNNPSEEYLSRFEGEKLIYPNLASRLFAVFDENGFCTNQKCFIITSQDYDLRFLSCLLSSKTLNFIFKFLGTPLQGKYYDLNKKFIQELPICYTTSENQQFLIKKADQILKLNRQLQDEVNGFNRWLQKEFGIEKLSQKLEAYYKLSEDEFIAEMRKKKVDTKSRKNREYLEREFNESLKIINPLLQKIKETDDEIDRMVYDLYGLTDEEIQIIEESLKN